MPPPDWVADAIFYQIFPDRFSSSARVAKPGRLEPWDSAPTRHGFKGGDLLGIVERLDYLEDLGINAIYLNPIFSSASNHRYHAFDYFAIDPLLGGEPAFRELLEAAHARGIRIILDGVFNHTGRGFWPFHHLLECGPDSPYVDWFLVRSWPLNAYSKRPPGYEAWWNLRALPKLNVGNPETREYVLRVAEHWTRRGIDGWRLDVPQEIDDADFWRTFRARVREAQPEAYLVGEIWNEAPEWLEGDRFDALMNYPLARTALGLCSRRLKRHTRQGGFRLQTLTAREALDQLLHQLGCYDERVVRSQLNLLGSHDTERILTVMGGDHDAVALAALLQLTLPGAPCIYYGDEVGMEGGKDPDCRRAVPWDEAAWHRPTRELMRGAIALRKARRALRHGSFEGLYAERRTLAFLRREAGERLLVAINAGGGEQRLRIPAEALGRGPAAVAAVELLSTRRGASALEIDARGALSVRIAPRAGIVVEVR